MSRKLVHVFRTDGLQLPWFPLLTKASCISSSSVQRHNCKFLIVGGGTGGITMAAKVLNLGEKDVTVVEPSEKHYYQPYWTLVGGRKKNFEMSFRPTSSVMPRHVNWIKDKVAEFDPKSNVIYTENNGKIKYQYLIVALGLQLAFEKIKGLPEAFDSKGVSSIYSMRTVKKTAQSLDDFVEGNAIFTQPINPIKCAGAPQKIMYLAEEYFKKTGKREKANIIFNTALGTIFSVPKYAAALRDVAESKNISVNCHCNLVEVKPDSREAVFQKLDAKGNSLGTVAYQYEMLHITPPMIAPAAISKSVLSDSSGFLDVNKHTLQSQKFSNVFGIGDCTNVPTSKTAAAVAGQCGVLTENLKLTLKGEDLTSKYFGYTSCPLVTGYNKGILAEFDYNLEPVETLPIDQGKERFISYFLKANLIPFVYWNFMLKGHWSGPGTVRKILHLGMCK